LRLKPTIVEKPTDGVKKRILQITLIVSKMLKGLLTEKTVSFRLNWCMSFSIAPNLFIQLHFNGMEKYIEWLENKIEVCLEDKDLQREHWAFCQALSKYRELALCQPPVTCCTDLECS
jgi:hypothetical protein